MRLKTWLTSLDVKIVDTSTAKESTLIQTAINLKSIAIDVSKDSTKAPLN